MYARWRNALPLLCDSTAKGGRLPQATRGGLCPTNPCALIGAVHCGAPTYRARSLTPTPTAPTLPRSHLTRVYTYGKGKCKCFAPLPPFRRASSPLGRASALAGSPTCFRSFQNNVAGHFGSTPPRLATFPRGSFFGVSAPSVGGSQQTPLRVVCFGRVRSTPPTLF